MYKTLRIAAVSTFSLFVGAQAAGAFGPGSIAKGLNDNAGVQYLVARQATLAPFAFVKFCRKNPADCRQSVGVSIADLTTTREKELYRVNRKINRSIEAVNELGTTDRWEVNVTQGDCEDFALTKRRELISLGWSPRALRLAVARTSSGEGHAVLVVKTSKGDLVLDNRTSDIKRWQRTDLSWVKIQSGENPRIWHSL